MPTFADRVINAWNAFRGKEPTSRSYYYNGYSSRPDRTHLSRGNDKSIVASIYNQIAVDVSNIDFKHVKVNEEGDYVDEIKDDLNNIFKINANLDQTGRQFIQDLVLSMIDEGVVAIIPTDAEPNPLRNSAFKVYTCRVGKIIGWLPKHVTVEVYNENTGKKEQLTLPKRIVPIIENPFYTVMNEPNSTLQRLLRVLNQIDRLNEQNAAGKMDLIIQVPYSIKGEARKNQANDRRKEIESQLTGSQYGIAYIDGTERVIQLNRAVENNLWNEAKDLQEELFNQLGMAKSIFDGTADEKTMLNYYNRTINPICTRIVEAIIYKWFTTNALSRGESLKYFRDPFKLVPVEQIAEIADKFTRNEILTKNEFRSIIGKKPSDDPKADMLRNSNINHPEDKMEAEQQMGMTGPQEGMEEEMPMEGESQESFRLSADTPISMLS